MLFKKTSGVYSQRPRFVTVWNEKKGEAVRLLTNSFRLGTSAIGLIYKEQWQIELFFKTLKETLNVKTFIGTSENALNIQIRTVMTALPVTKWLHRLSRARWSVSVLSAMLRMNLFTYRPLPEGLDEPYETPPAGPQVTKGSVLHDGGTRKRTVLDRPPNL